MATEQAWERMKNLPMQLASNLPLVIAMGIINTATDAIVGPPNEITGDFWDADDLSANVKDAFVVSFQDAAKFATARFMQPIGLIPIAPPTNGSDGAQAFHSAYY